MEIDAITRSKLKNVVFTSTEPPSTNVLWVKPNGNEVTMYIFKNGSWQALTGGEIDSTVYAYIDTQDAATLASAKEYADSSLATEITKVNETEATIQNNVSTNATDISTLKGYFEDGVANKAKQLATEVTLWGNKFDGTTSIEGTSNKNGDLINIGNAGNSNFCIEGVAANVDYTHLYITQNHRPIVMQYGHGNVGIGTATPSNKLEVSGTFKVTGDTTIGGNLTVAGSITAGDSSFATTDYVDTEVAKKQDTLVSGTNIKTINKQSILGEGNITIEGTGSSEIPKIWAILRASRDCAIKVDGEVVELPAKKSVEIKNFSSWESYSDANYSDPKYIELFNIHYNGFVPITHFQNCIVMVTKEEPNSKAERHITDITTLDVSCFDTSNMTSMEFMFHSMSALTSLDVSNFDTSKCTSMFCMFYGLKKVTALDVSGFDTSKVTNFCCFASECNTLSSIDVSSFNTSNVTDFSYMFFNCQKLNNLDLRRFDMSKTTTLDGMFYACYALTDVQFGEKWGAQTSTASNALLLQLYYLGSRNSYKLTDNTWNSMLNMYDRASAGLPTMTIQLCSKHNIPDGWTDKMTARGYTITIS